jgi:hypothetical protein
MPDGPTTSRARIGAAAGAAGAAAVFALVMGVGPAPSVFQLAGADEDVSGPCDEAEHVDDPQCQGPSSTAGADSSTSTTDDEGTSTTVDDTTSSTSGAGAGGTGAPTDEIRSLDAAGAGTVIYAVEGDSFRLISATPAGGWRVDVEQSTGREIDLDFRSGTRRVQVDIELEDGQVRERVRFRDDADDTDIRTEDGVVQDDSSGPGSGGEDTTDDNSGSGSGDGDTDDSSGPGGDDEDRSGTNSGSG